MEYATQFNYRPDDLSTKQDQIIQLVAQYVAYSRDPSQYQFKVLERTLHNHNFTFMKEGDRAYNYYSFLLHTHMGRAQAGYKNERYQRDQFSDTYAQQLAKQEAAIASAYHATVDFAPAPTNDQKVVSATNSKSAGEGPPLKAARVEGPPFGHHPDASVADDEDDDDDAPAFKIIVDENGVQRIVKS